MQQIELVDVKLLCKHNKNPRTITKEDFENLKKRMQKDPKFFEMRPLLISRNENALTIYAGNQRFEAAKSLKYKTCPGIVEDNVPEDLQRERMIADNLHHGSFDYDILANDFEDVDLIELGFKDFDFKAMKDVEADIENEKQDEEEKTQTIKCPNCSHEFSV